MLLLDSHVLNLNVGCVLNSALLHGIVEFSELFNPDGLWLLAFLLELLDLDSGLLNLADESLDHFFNSLVLLDGCLDSLLRNHELDLFECGLEVDHAV